MGQPSRQDPTRDALRVQPVLDGALVLIARPRGTVMLALRVSEAETRTAEMSREDAALLGKIISAFVETLPDRREVSEDARPEPPAVSGEGECPRCQGPRMLVAENDPTMRRCLTCEHVWRVVSHD